MDATGRKAFWDTLCSLHAYDSESMGKLTEAAPIPQELCRFRAVNENSLVQLQNNAQLFSTANYYDDPFDSYFSIDFQALQNVCKDIMDMLEQNNVGTIKALLTAFDLGDNVDVIIQSMKTANVDMNWLKLTLKDVRDLVRRQINSICFCEDAMNETMWLKYADQHKGFVQVYDFHDPSTILCGKEPNCDKCGIKKHPPMIFPIYYGNQIANCNNKLDTPW